jgi:hypothetical protein
MWRWDWRHGSSTTGMGSWAGMKLMLLLWRIGNRRRGKRLLLVLLKRSWLRNKWRPHGWSDRQRHWHWHRRRGKLLRLHP